MALFLRFYAAKACLHSGLSQEKIKTEGLRNALFFNPS